MARSEMGETWRVSQVCFTRLLRNPLREGWWSLGQHQSPSGRDGPRLGPRRPGCGPAILDPAMEQHRVLCALTGKASDKSLGVTVDKSLKQLPGACSGSDLGEKSAAHLSGHVEAKTSF